jgi:hypothetical protein
MPNTPQWMNISYTPKSKATVDTLSRVAEPNIPQQMNISYTPKSKAIVDTLLRVAKQKVWRSYAFVMKEIIDETFTLVT